jgi:3-hydroxyacyl-[acyl-carrier-protein] dehydratase
MRWIWIDRFEEFVPGVRATAIKNVSLAEEHLHDHWEAFPIHPASLMIEGMAQTGGILVGQARNFEEKVLLGKVVKAEFDDIVCPGDQITYQAVVDTVNQDASFIRGVILKNGLEIGRVELMFTHVDHNMAGLEFPEENFVFTGQFMRLVAPFLEDDHA